MEINIEKILKSISDTYGQKNSDIIEHIVELPKHQSFLVIWAMNEYDLNAEDAIAVVEACFLELHYAEQDPSSFLTERKSGEVKFLRVKQEEALAEMIKIMQDMDCLAGAPEDQRGLIRSMVDEYNLKPDVAAKVAEAFYAEMALREGERNVSPSPEI